MFSGFGPQLTSLIFASHLKLDWSNQSSIWVNIMFAWSSSNEFYLQ